MRHLVLATATALVAFVASRPSHACTAPACNESWSAPEAGKSVPANAPAIVFHQGTAPISAGGTPTFSAPTLKTKDGTAVPFTIDGDLLKPTFPLPTGELVLGYDEGCVSPAPDGGVTAKTLSFDVGPSAPLPTAMGTVTVTYARRTVQVVSYSGSCTGSLDAAVADLVVALDPKLVPFRSITRFVTTVDGKDWAKTVFGRDTPTPSTPAYGMAAGARRPDVVFAGCGSASDAGPDTADDRGLSPGKHKVTIVAEIAGAPALPAVDVDIDLRCDATPSEPKPDARLPPEDGGDDGSGCAMGARPADSAGSAAVFGLLLVLGAALDRPRGRR